jgi:hypothetical protein
MKGINKMGKVKKHLMVVIVLLIFSFFGNHFCIAADSTNDDEVYIKFLNAIGIEAQYNQMINLMVTQYQQSFVTGVQTAIKKISDVSEKDKTEIQKVANESMSSFLQKLKVKMNEIMPFQELVKTIYMPIYKKNFTIDEIKEITSFYEKETGKKFISMATTLMQESAAIYNQNYNQKIMQAGTSLAETEFSKVKEVMENLKKNQSASQSNETATK